MSKTINKSPINVLDEFCIRKLQPPPEYTLSSDNNKDFVCTVNSFNETKTATAASKKKAKHVAAQNLIRHLRSLESFKFDLVFLPDVVDSVDDAEVSSSTKIGKKRKSPAKSEPDINYIGKLLEYCVKNKLPPASFDIIEYSAHTQSHLREFCMKCRVNDVERQGKGFSKQQAKKNAAMEVLKVLMEGKPEPNVVSESKQPLQKRIKLTEAQTSQKTIDTILQNIVPPEQNTEKATEHQINYDCDSSDDSDEDNTGNIFDDDRIDSNEVLESEDGSEQDLENESAEESDYDGL